jgi:hypothetical protein
MAVLANEGIGKAHKLDLKKSVCECFKNEESKDERRV